MKLYHGGSAAVLDRVKREGLLPRAIHKGKDNWKHTVMSNRNAIYLTDAYPWHFAACASDEKEKGIIYEIDHDFLLPWLLCPDEDFLEQASRSVPPSEKNPQLAPTDWPMKKRTLYYRKIARHNPKMADVSLEHMGTCAYYGKISFKAITRYVVIDWTKLHSAMHLNAVDSMVSCLNYKILQDRHRAFVRWFFNDPVTPAELTGSAIWRQAEGGLPPEMKKIYDEQDSAYEKVMSERAGLEVINLRKQKAA